MPGSIPDKIWLYRLVHHRNVAHILTHGMYCRRHALFDPGYVHIGDSRLIGQREHHMVPLPGGDELGGYVPFYLGGHSPMLLNIITGHRNVARLPQRDLVYILCSLHGIENAGCRYIYTDGHARDRLTGFHREREHLDRIDWDMVRANPWNNTEADSDRQRRKQAEFLVHEHVPLRCVEAIATYDEERAAEMRILVAERGLTIRVKADTTRLLFYP